MTIRTLVDKLTDADLDKRVDVIAWRQKKKLANSDKAYFGLWIAKGDTNQFNKLSHSVEIPETGATIRTLLGELTNTELDKEVDVIEWRREKNLPDTEIAHLQAFICLKNGTKWIKLFDILVPEGHNHIEAMHISKDIDKQDETHFYYPTREDFVNAMGRLNKEIPIDDILDTMEINLINAGYQLHSDWRFVTEKNVAIWSQKEG